MVWPTHDTYAHTFAESPSGENPIGGELRERRLEKNNYGVAKIPSSSRNFPRLFRHVMKFLQKSKQ